MTLRRSDRVSLRYLDPHRNDGVSEDHCVSWFEQDIANEVWEDAKWIEITESFFSFGAAIVQFLGSESVGRGLQRLDLGSLQISQSGVLALASNPAMTALETLDLGDMDNDVEDVFEHLMRSPFLTNLKSIRIAQYTLTTSDVAALADDGRQWTRFALECVACSNTLGQLFAQPSNMSMNTLSLRRCVMTPEDLESLSRSTCIKALDTLILNHAQFDDYEFVGFGVVNVLFSQHHEYNLKTLSLECVSDEDEQANLIQAWPTTLSLTSLNLAENELDHKALNALLCHPVCSTLKRLNVSTNEQLGDAGARVLAESMAISQLETLKLNDCELSIVGLRLILESKNLCALTREGLSVGELAMPESLERLSGLDKVHFILESGMLDYSFTVDLSHEALDDQCIALLTSHPKAHEIQNLHLNSCELTDAHFLTLLSPESSLTSLVLLSLDDNHLTNDVMRQVAPLQKLRDLEVLSLCDNRIGASGAHEICGGNWRFIYLDGNKASTGPDDDIYKLIDWYWSSSAGDRIDIVSEAR